MNVEDQIKLEAMTKSIYNELQNHGVHTLTTVRTTKTGEVIPDYCLMDDEESVQALKSIPDTWKYKDNLHQDLLIFAYQIYCKALKTDHIKNKIAYTEIVLKNKKLLIIESNNKELNACNGYASENYEVNDTDYESRCFLEAKTVPNLEYKTEIEQKEKEAKDSNRKPRNASWNPYFYDVLKRYRLPGMTQERLALHYNISRRTLCSYLHYNFVTKQQLSPGQYLELYAKQFGEDQFYQHCKKNIELFSIEDASRKVFCANGSLIVLEDDEKEIENSFSEMRKKGQIVLDSAI